MEHLATEMQCYYNYRQMLKGNFQRIIIYERRELSNSADWRFNRMMCQKVIISGSGLLTCGRLIQVRLTCQRLGLTAYGPNSRVSGACSVAFTCEQYHQSFNSNICSGNNAAAGYAPKTGDFPDFRNLESESKRWNVILFSEKFGVKHRLNGTYAEALTMARDTVTKTLRREKSDIGNNPGHSQGESWSRRGNWPAMGTRTSHQTYSKHSKQRLRRNDCCSEGQDDDDGEDPVSGHDIGTRRGIFDYRRLMANRTWEVTLGNDLSFSASITERSRGGHLTIQTGFRSSG
jgi:hypothetical protein